MRFRGVPGHAQHRAFLQKWLTGAVFRFLRNQLQRGPVRASAFVWAVIRLDGVASYTAKNLLSAAFALDLISEWDRGPVGPGADCAAMYLCYGRVGRAANTGGAYPWAVAARQLMLHAVVATMAAMASSWLGMEVRPQDAQEALCFFWKYRAGRLSLS